MTRFIFMFMFILSWGTYTKVYAQQLKIVCDANEYRCDPSGVASDRLVRVIEAFVDTIYISKSMDGMTCSSYKMGWKITLHRGQCTYWEESGDDEELSSDGEAVQMVSFNLYENDWVGVSYIKSEGLSHSFLSVGISEDNYYVHNVSHGYRWNGQIHGWEKISCGKQKEYGVLDKFLIAYIKNLKDSSQEEVEVTVSEEPVVSPEQKTRVITLPGSNHSLKMVYVDGGSFNYRNKQVCFVSGFYMGQTEVTQALWQAVMKNNPSIDKGDLLPINNITYYQALAFCKKLSALTGQKFRLPQDIEWEYAATGGQFSRNYPYAGSNDPLEVGWVKENCQGKLHPVGQKKPNELGLYDMSGNVKEMCSDYIDAFHAESEKLPGSERRARGGSWETSAVLLRGKFYNGYSDSYTQGFGNRYLGFRVVMEK